MRLEIPVDHSVLVGTGEGLADLQAVLQRVLQRQRLACHHLVESAAVDQLHGDEVAASNLVDLVDRDDVAVVEARRCLRFLGEALARRVVGQGPLVQQLQRHRAPQLGVEGAVDDAHAAAADLLEDLEVEESLADHGEGVAHRSRRA